MVSKFTLFKLKGKTMLKRLFFITSLFLAACSTVEDVPLPVTSSSEKALELYNEALEYQSKWEGREARQKMAAALRIDPNFILANLYAGADEASLVRQYRSRAVANKSNGTEAEEIKVDIWLARREGRQKDAMELAKRLIDLYPNSSEPYVILGDMQSQATEFEDAIESYNKATNINPKNLDAWFGLFTHQIPINYFYKLAPENLRSREKAIFYADKMIEVAPNNPRSYNLRANIDRKDGNFEEAKKYYQKALDICNETGSSAKPTTLLVGGHNHMFSGDDETAMKFYQEAQDVAENGDSKRNMGFYKAILHLYNNDFYSAFDEFDKLENQLDDWGFDKAGLLSSKGQVQFNKFFTLAHLQEKEKSWKELKKSQDSFKKELKLNESATDREYKNQEQTFLSNEAWYHILFGEYDKAEKKLAKVYLIQSEKESPNALDNYNALYGMLYLMKGDPKSSLEYFNDRINVQNFPYFSYFKGLALKATGYSEKAMSIFTEIANYNFSGWEAGLVRTLAEKQVAS